MIGNQVAKWTGQGGAGQIMYIAGFATIMFALALQLVIDGTIVPGLGNAIAIVVAVVLIGFTAISGAGKTKTVDVTFECNEWEPPFNGDDCEYCNQPGMTCTEYKCHSLGQACKIINPGSQYPLCIGDTNDGHPPVLTTDETE